MPASDGKPEGNLEGKPEAASGNDHGITAALKELSIVIHNVPDFPEGSQILGLCSVTPENNDNNLQGWMVKDFLRWIRLFHKVGRRDAQKWLSFVDMVQYVADHVPEGLDERPVESIFGQQRDHVQQVKPGGAEMVDVFLQQVRERAIVADKTGKALVIVYMGPVTPEQDLCIDVAENAFVTAGQIRNAVNDSINGRELSVILVTTSLFTGGWLCKPALNGSTSLSSELERNGTFFRLVAKNTGCAFASRHINKFTCKETPLLTEEERARVRYHDIMPTAPSVQQTSKKSELHQDIHKSLQCCFDDLPDFHHFEFDVKYDGWTEMAPRTGRDLSQWAVNTHRERALPDGNHDREHEKWVHDNSHGFQLIGTRFGGIRSSQVHHLKLLVTLERNTCPGDWKGIETGETSRLFNDFLKLSESEISDVQYKLIFDIVEFRASLNKLAQFLAAYHGLSRSNTGESARFWIEPTGKDLVYLGQLNKAFGLIRFLAPPPDDMVSGFALSRGSVQHDFHKVRYWRPSLWLAAAIVGKHSVGSAEWIKRDLFPVLRSVFDAQIALLKTTPVVVHSGLDFLKSVGVLSSSPDDPIPVVHSGTRTPVSLDRSVARPNDVVHAQTAVGSPGSKLTAASFKAPIDQIKEFIPRGKVPNDKPLTFKAPVDLASKTWALDFTTSGIQVPEEARASEAKAPEIKAHGIKASKDMVFELKTPETKAPEIKAPEMKAPEMKAPEFEAFDSRTSDKGKAEEISVDWENGNTARVVAASPADQGLPQASLATVSTAAVACGPPSDLDDALLLQTLATLSGDDSRIAFIKLWNEMKNRKSANQANRNMASSTDGPVKGGSGPSAAQSPRPVATTNGGGHGSKLAAAMPDKLDVKAQHPTPPVSPSVAAAPAAYAQRPGGFPIFDPCQVQW